MARSLADVVFRRTELCTAGHPGEEALLASAALAGHELGWDAEKTRHELKVVGDALRAGIHV